VTDAHELGIALAVAAARLVRLAARESGATLSPATWRALSQVDEHGPLRIGDLARLDRCSQPTATALVQRLVEAGWLAREPDPADARAVQVSLTPAGRNELARARSAAGAALAPRLERLPDKELARLDAGLEVLQRLVAVPVEQETPA
jgi:DNA-binding MarR family transcriptional regulator